MLGELYQAAAAAAVAGATPELFHKFIMNASSEMSKASRRKQSKPNRLLADEEAAAKKGAKVPLEATEDKRVGEEEQISEPEQVGDEDDNRQPLNCDQQIQSEKDPMDLSTTKSSRLDGAASPQPTNIADQHLAAVVSSGQQLVNFPCHTCGEAFSSRAAQEQHFMEKHTDSRDEDRNRTSPPGPIFPAAYHRLATDLGLGMAPPQAAKQSSDPTKNTLCGPQSGSTSVSNSATIGVPKPGTPGVGGKGTAGSVFQREAYCEICQREFCNKYFLKTHKANIHGIVDPNDPKSVAAAAKLSQTPSKGNLIVAEPQNSHRINSNPPALSHSTGSINPPTSSKSSTTSGGGDNMDDFCEICQKHFCNKYYLKKHKVDVHNIRPDGSGKAASSAPVETKSDSNLMPPGIPSVSSGLSMPMMVPPLNGAPSSLNPTSMNNMLFVNPFMPGMTAMSMFPPMMQQQLFMQGLQGIGGMAAAHTPTQISTGLLGDLKKAEQPVTLANSTTGRDDGSNVGDKAEAFCDICKKEFCNIYYLQLHKATKHGAVDNPTALMMLIAEKEKAEKEALLGLGRVSSGSTGSPSPPHGLLGAAANKPVVLSVDKDRSKTSPAFPLTAGLGSMHSAHQLINFDSMMAEKQAKQADRITCDICNKEVCNKYFLKSHKLNMHGVSSPTSDDKQSNHSKDEPMKKVTPRTSPEPKSMLESTPDSLIKMGVDPETYCYLCKKGFCSKYFLKSHKQNVHGIFSDDTPKGTITPPTSVSPISSHQQLSMGFHPLTMSDEWKLKEQMKSGSSHELMSGGGDRFTWRWKDASNSARVFCDICNKQLCNKYFLRTHKWKIHGIRDGEAGSKTSRLNSSSAANASSEKSGRSGSSKRVVSSSPIHDRGQKSGQSDRSSPPASPSLSCSSATAVVTTRTAAADHDKLASLRANVCQVCGMIFASCDAVTEHMKLDHTSEEIEALYKELRASNGQKEVFECTHCPFKTSVLSNIYIHEARSHASDSITCKLCPTTLTNIGTLVKHTRKTHGKHLFLKDVKTNVSRKIQCNFCNEKFLNKQLCQSHIRNTHRITAAASADKNGDKRVFACDQCRYTTKSLRNLRMHQSIRHQCDGNKKQAVLSRSHSSSSVTMQEFVVKSVSGCVESLASHTVCLPVHERVDEEMLLNLTLLPLTKSAQDHELSSSLDDDIDMQMDTTTTTNATS